MLGATHGPIATTPTTTGAPASSGFGSFFNDALSIGGRVLEGFGEWELAKYQIKQQTALQNMQNQQEKAAEQTRSTAAAEVTSQKWVKPVALGGVAIVGGLVLLKAFKVI